MYRKGLTIEDYINLAGGVREYGDASKVYIVRANGSVAIPKNDFWFSGDSQTMLEPGDTIVVPRDVTNYDNISLWQGVTQIIYQSAVALAAIGSL
jgi:protein involved in polysaccharide export with SLBB domain